MSESIHKVEQDGELRLDLPAAHSAGRMARQMVRQFAVTHGVPEDEVQTLEFVSGELIDNAVDHGGGGAAREISELERDVRVSLRLQVDTGAWAVAVGDQGGGEPEVMRPFLDADAIPDLDDERGRGFFLLVQMVDGIDVRKTDDGLGLEFEARRRYAGA